MYKLDQVWTDDALNNYLWEEGWLSFLHLKKYRGYHLSASLVESEGDSDYLIWINIQRRM